MAHRKRLSLVMVLVLLFTAVASAVSAAPAAQERIYTVQKDDNLWRLAEKYLGNGAAYPAIVAATNAKHAEDETFAFIENPSLIHPGWKLLIPAPEDAARLVEGYRAATTPKRGGTIVVGLRGPVLTLDPADYRDRITETALRNIFDGLVTRTVENEVVLELAESAELIEPAVWEFKLKKGVTFHNGEPLTAEDVKFTFDRIITEGGIDYPEPHTAARKGLIAPLQEVEIVDDYTVRFHLSAPWPVFMQMLVHQQIVPKDYFEEVGTKGFIEHPIGAGPFKFVEGKLDEQIVLERYEDYYGGADDLPPVGPAFVDRVIFKVLPEDATRVAALQAGEANIIQGVPAHVIPALEKDPNVVVKACGGTRPHFMEMNVTKPPFDDVRVRKAMNYAVDVETIINKLYGGRATVLPGPLSPFNNFVDKTLQPYGYDPEKAKALLAEAGYADGFSFVIDASADYKELAEAIAGQVRNIGIDASVRVWDWAVVKPLLLAGERQAVVGSWGDSAFDPVGYMEAKWRTPVEGTGKGRGNYSQYSNPRVDELIDAGEVETDVAKRHEIYNEAQRIIWDEAPCVFLFVPQEVEACTANVMNWEPSPDSRINLHDVWLK
ncbi:MAG: LysM peptidoglycan-binding domain-containing protein [Anaerolineae bacterium]|nr:LysM peptidoglycan-binding domain-containing protein [Anaerolineae bacterium]